ncbi:MAG: glycosyltransferase [Anaerolineaceae bacterium]
MGGFLGLLPAGGITWDYIQYPLGFASLGHDVYYVEDTGLWPVYQTNPTERISCAANVEHLERVMNAFGMADRWAYRDEVTGDWHGMPESAVVKICRTADVFVNISCSTIVRDQYRLIPTRILIDSDPMFTQIQYVSQSAFTPGGGGMRALVADHTHHFTFGESIGESDCLIPDTSITWHTTRQPICLDQWVGSDVPFDSTGFTTVMNWIAGRPLVFNGQTWGQKDVEFMHVLEIPRRVNAPFAVVVGQTTGAPFPRQLAEDAGWTVLDPHRATGNWLAYRNFIESSTGEFSVAKESYVKARTGWFSCRSACYLASGRPVVTQDTGWTRHIPSGSGLIGFTNPDEAVAALERVISHPRKNAKSAREIAEQAFDARVVLRNLLSTAGAT